MSKFGSSSILLLVDGYDMSVNKLQGLNYKIQSITEPTHGIGDSWEENTPVGLSRAELTQEGAFFDSSTSGGFLHVLNSTTIGGQSPSSTGKVVCIGVAGNTTGKPFVGFKGELVQDYEVLGSVGKLTRANVSYVVTGNAEHGTIIRPVTTTTASVTSYLDNSAQTTNGGSAYVQVTAITNLVSTGITIVISDAAASSGTYVAIGTVTTTGIGGWQVATTDNTIGRWLSAAVNVTTSGCPSLTCFVGYSRL